MKTWTIAAAAAAGLMSLSLLSAPASADSRGHHWGGNSYSRHNDCNDNRHYSGGRHRDHGNYGHHRGGQRFGWNDRRWDNNNWRDNDRHPDRGKHRWRHRDRDHDGDRGRHGRRDRRWN